MLQRDPLRSPLADGPTSGRAQGLHLPFLPTLAMALAAAAVSLLCQEPSPVPAPIAPVATAGIVIDPTSFAWRSGAPAETDVLRPAAALAFAQLHPLLPEAAEARVAVRAVSPRVAVLPPRRPCLGPRCGEPAVPRRANPFAAVRPAQDGHGEPSPVDFGQAQTGEAEATAEGPAFPSLALPFAPAARVVGQAAGMMRSGAAALGTSVVLLVDRMR